VRIDGYVVGIISAICIASCFIVLFFVIWKGTTTGQVAETEQMRACVESGKTWDWQSEDNVRVCK